jgi:hypothetical protein
MCKGWRGVSGAVVARVKRGPTRAVVLPSMNYPLPLVPLTPLVFALTQEGHYPAMRRFQLRQGRIALGNGAAWYHVLATGQTMT